MTEESKETEERKECTLLSLGLATLSNFYVGGKKFCVSKIYDGLSFRVTDNDGEDYEITDKKSVKIMEDVYVSAGLNGTNKLARLAIEAPKSIEILRPKVYWKQKNEEAKKTKEEGEKSNAGS